MFGVDKVVAYYVAADKHVVVVADVLQSPVADHVHICPNPIAIPPAREFIVVGTTDPGIHPQLVVKRRISTTFASDLTPKTVIVYTRGIDAPVRQEIPVGSTPPPPVQAGEGDPLAEPPPPTPIEVTGFSPTFSMAQALEDALTQAVAKLGAAHGPDAAIVIDILDITARRGGNVRQGLFVRATGR
ncbi:MAG TPA: hypothetical protein VHW23_01830 [Kofleriaceae bacterium]|nr:hypothetical protein [Kofleriaceae bacterium]